jgi:hypothetical protein
LQEIDFKSGYVTTCLPTFTPIEQAQQFNIGGKSNPEHSFISNGYRVESVPTFDTQLIMAIQQHLQQSQQNLCLFEDRLSKPSDPFLKKIDDPIKGMTECKVGFAIHAKQVLHSLLECENSTLMKK